MRKLICIVGATATGKTKKAIELYQQTPSILVSADSRQVYLGMDIVTGKDHPKDISIYGIDILDPNQSISVAVWYDAVMPHINQAWDEGKQVIVVGGTGLYVKALTDGIDTMKVPINPSLRDNLSSLTVSDLQGILKEINQAKFESMNNSDQNNPRRLIRAIEVARFLHSGRNDEHLSSRASREISTNIEMIGLKYSDLSIQRNQIFERVNQRLELGAVQETRNLLNQYGPTHQSLSAIGYSSIIDFLDGQLSQEAMIESWVEGEFAYAKRQMTWFRKQSVIWYDA